MDPAVKDIRIEEAADPASEFVQSIISALSGSNEIAKSRQAQRQWYESLPEEQQMQVRDRIREEISRVRAQFGKRSPSASSSYPVRLRDHG